MLKNYMSRDDQIFALTIIIVTTVFGLSYARATSQEIASWAQAIGSVAAVGAAVWVAQRSRQDAHDERSARAALLAFKITPELVTIRGDVARAAAACELADFATIPIVRFQSENWIGQLSIYGTIAPAVLDMAWVLPPHIAVALSQLSHAIDRHRRMLDERIPQTPFLSIMDRIRLIGDTTVSLRAIDRLAVEIQTFCVPITDAVVRNRRGARS